MTPREGFKFGFLLRCADENLSEEETVERIKQANAIMSSIAVGAPPESDVTAPTPQRPKILPRRAQPGSVVPTAAGTGSSIGSQDAACTTKVAAGLIDTAGNLAYGTAIAGLGLGALTGAAGGYGLAKALEPEGDANEQKQRELIDAYKVQTARVQQARARRGFRQKRPEFMLSPTS